MLRTYDIITDIRNFKYLILVILEVRTACPVVALAKSGLSDSEFRNETIANIRYLKLGCAGVHKVG